MIEQHMLIRVPAILIPHFFHIHHIACNALVTVRSHFYESFKFRSYLRFEFLFCGIYAAHKVAAYISRVTETQCTLPMPH